MLILQSPGPKVFSSAFPKLAEVCSWLTEHSCVTALLFFAHIHRFSLHKCKSAVAIQQTRTPFLYCGLESLLQCKCMTPVTKLLMLNLLTETWRGKGELEAVHMSVLTEDGSPGGFLIFFGWVSEKRKKVTKLSAQWILTQSHMSESSQFCYVNISLTNVSIWWASPGVVGECGVKLRARFQAWRRHGISIGHYDVWRQEPLLHRQNKADHTEIFTLLLVNHIKAKSRSKRSLPCQGVFNNTFFQSLSYLGTKWRIRSPFIFSCMQKIYIVLSMTLWHED